MYVFHSGLALIIFNIGKFVALLNLSVRATESRFWLAATYIRAKFRAQKWGINFSLSSEICYGKSQNLVRKRIEVRCRPHKLQPHQKLGETSHPQITKLITILGVQVLCKLLFLLTMPVSSNVKKP